MSKRYGRNQKRKAAMALKEQDALIAFLKRKVHSLEVEGEENVRLLQDVSDILGDNFFVTSQDTIHIHPSSPSLTLPHYSSTNFEDDGCDYGKLSYKVHMLSRVEFKGQVDKLRELVCIKAYVQDKPVICIQTGTKAWDCVPDRVLEKSLARSMKDMIKHLIKEIKGELNVTHKKEQDVVRR